MKIEALKHYFKTLLTAVAGRNPYGRELEDLRKEHKDAIMEVKKLEERMNGLQNLVEILRQRVNEKDEMISLMQEQYGKEADGSRREKEDAKKKEKKNKKAKEKTA